MKNEESLRNAAAVTSQLAEDHGIGLGQLVALLWTGKWIIVATTIVGVLLGKFYSQLPAPEYVADGLVQIEKSQGAAFDIRDMLGDSAVDVSAELQIIQSRMLMDEVIERLNLKVKVWPKTFGSIGAVMARRWGNKPPRPAPFGVDSYAWGGESIDVPTFDVPSGMEGRTFKIVTQPDGYRLEAPDGAEILRGKVGTLAQSDSPQIRIFVAELTARPGTNFMIQRLTSQQAYGVLRRGLEVREQGGSGILRLTVTGPSPEFVTDAVNAFEGAYLRQNVERKSADAEQTLKFLKEQIPLLKDRLDQSQSTLSEYLRRSDSVDIDAQSSAVLQQIVDAQTKLQELQLQRQAALERFTPEHPNIKAMDLQIQSYRTRMAEMQNQVDGLPDKQKNVLNLRRDVEVTTEIYVSMVNTMQELEVARAGTLGNVRILDRAIHPLGPSGPNRRAILMLMSAVGFVLGIGLVLLRRLLIRGVDDPAQLEAQLGLTTYAAIPYDPAQRRMLLSARKHQSMHGVIAASQTKSLVAESFRSLRSALYFALADAQNNVVMLTGPEKGVGKSFVAANLGAILAQAGKTVALVDADCRAGSLHRYLGFGHAPGLSDFLVGSATEECIINQKSEIENVSIIVRGTVPPNPSELLLNQRFIDLIQRLSERFDYVLIDTPPVLPVTDATIVGRLAGCTLLVLKEAQHTMREISEARRRVDSAGGHVKGVIMNQVGLKAGSYGYSNYGYGYGYIPYKDD